MRRHDRRTTSQVDVDPAGVFLGGELEMEFLADLLDARLDLLDVTGRVVALSDDAVSTSQCISSSYWTFAFVGDLFQLCLHVQMRLTMLFRIFYPSLKNFLCFLDELSM